jgi:hypothetical protein
VSAEDPVRLVRARDGSSWRIGTDADVAWIAAGTSVSRLTHDRYGHLLPEVDKQAATKLEAVRAATRLA